MDIGNNVLRNILGGKKVKCRSGGRTLKSGPGFPRRVKEKMEGTGWFATKDVVPLYKEYRKEVPVVHKQTGYSGYGQNPIWHTTDASYSLGGMAKRGDLERRPHPTYKHKFQWRVTKR